jgi:hypothetical protein
VNLVARKRLGLAVASVLVFVGVVVVVRLVACGLTACINTDENVGLGDSLFGGGEQNRPSLLFGIAGDATEQIKPGVMVPLDLKLTNPHDAALSVTDLRVEVRAVSAPNADDAHPCTVDDFAVDQVPQGFTVTVVAHTTSPLSGLGVPLSARPKVGMVNRPVNQDGCKGASLSLAYTAAGTLRR